MTYSINGTVVIDANAQVAWSKINPGVTVITVNTTMNVVNTGTELANGYYIDLVGTDLRAYRVLGNCNCNCNCECGGSGD